VEIRRDEDVDGGRIFPVAGNVDKDEEHFRRWGKE
jgi:hypothetical protein